MWTEAILSRLHRTIQFLNCAKAQGCLKKQTVGAGQPANPKFERAVRKAAQQKVKVLSMTDGAVAQLARAPALHAGGQGFESLQLHHLLQCPLSGHVRP